MPELAHRIPRIEMLAPLKQSPVVGQFYLVPCIMDHGTWTPVIDNLHTDQEIAPSIGPHYHYDWRFINEALAWNVFGVPLKNDDQPSAVCFSKIFSVRRKYEVVTKSGETETGIWHALDTPPAWKRRRCVRSGVTFPIHFPPVFEQPRFQALTFKVEQLCAGKRIDPANPVCAHRGIPLGDIPPDADGCVTCPGHGLRWNLSTGEIVHRYTADEEEEAYYADKIIVKMPVSAEAAHAL